MKRKIFLSIIIFFTATVIFAADWSAVVRNYGAATGKITVTNGKGAVISQGSGFIIETEEGLLRMVTNAHVAAEAEHADDVILSAEFLYPGNDKQIYPLTIDLIDRELDLCLLTISGESLTAMKLSNKEKPSLMNEILVIGYPLGRSFKTTPGYIQAYQDVDGMGEMLDLSAVVAPGNSGGPVINERGEVIGVITAVIPGYNFNLAIPSANLLSFITRDTSSTSVVIDSEPEGAWVFIDSEYKGKTPLKLNLFNRSYKLRLEKEGYSVSEQAIGSRAGFSSRFDIKLEAEVDTNPVVEIHITPSDADISVNNKDLGSAPVSLQVPAGSILRIRLSAPGYKEKLEFYEVSDDDRQSIEFVLKKKFLFW